MFPHVVTIFNVYNGNVYAHVIKGVLIEPTKNTHLNAVGVTASDIVTLHIPYEKSGYVSPQQYNGDGWTLKTFSDGSGVGTYFAKGSFEPMTFAELKKNYPNVFRVNSISEYDYGLKHWEVGGV